MTRERVQALVFGEVADEYDRIRPGYPPALVDDVLAYAQLDGSPALEVGAGTGKATLAFAARGVTITTVEPDEEMARVLTRRVAGTPDVTVTVSSFEDFTPSGAFGLLFSAQAWHWTDPAVRWQRAAAALAPGGALALFWNMDRPADPDLLAAVLAIHEAHGATMTYDPEPTTEASLRTEWPGTDLDTLPDFGDLSERVYRRERTLSSADYLAYLHTQSPYRMLAEEVRANLFRAVEDLLPQRLVMDVDTALYLARRLPR